MNKIKVSKLHRLMYLAHQFYSQAESPDEEAIDSLFFYLASQNVQRLEELCKGWNVRITEETK